MNKRVGLYFGSFNPVHVGHLVMAESVLNSELVDEIWFILSPHNPIKNLKDLATFEHRFTMLSMATYNNPRFIVSTIEQDIYGLGEKSYSFKTLEIISDMYPDIDFGIIMGSDTFAGIRDWKNYKWIVENFQLLLVNRLPEIVTDEMCQFDFIPKELCIIKDSPAIGISSTYVRKLIHNNKSVKYVVRDSVASYIKIHQLYY